MRGRIGFTVSIMALALLAGCLSSGRQVVSDDFDDAFNQFSSSSYLQDLWNKTCVFPLRMENLMVIAKVVEGPDGATTECRWWRQPTGKRDEAGVVFGQAASDINAAWLDCGSPEFTDRMVDAIHHPGSPLVHLGEGVGEDADGPVYVVVSKCHFWDGYYCSRINSRFCRLEDAGEITSVAYAVLDGDGRVYW